MTGLRLFPLLLALAACGPAGLVQDNPPVDLSLQTRAVSSAALFGPPRPTAPERSNAQIVRDILALGFRLESGRALPVLSRFEGPVTLSLQGAVPPLAPIEADRLVARLRSEARLDITRVAQGGNLVVEFVPRAEMRRVVPEAACFVLPNVSSWAEFRAAPRDARLDWVQVARRERALVIAPSDTSVQEMRDCLHEEVAQALGPLNDLFRIGETVWNDDNFQTVLTGYDMLVLRVWNDAALRSGMSPQEVAQRLPAIVNRLNPRGARQVGPLDPEPTPRAWIDAIEGALSLPSRRQAFQQARRAVAIALEQGWQDERTAFSLFLAARFAPPEDGPQALNALIAAGRIYAERPGTDVQRAHVDLHLAAQALASGQNDLVLRLTAGAKPAARRTENGALLSSLMLLRAQALERMGRRVEAETLRREAVPFAIFGFGSDQALANRRDEIAALVGPR